MSDYNKLSIEEFEELCEISSPQFILTSVSEEIKIVRKHLGVGENILLTGSLSVHGKCNLFILTESRICWLYYDAFTSCRYENVDSVLEGRFSFLVKFQTKWGPKEVEFDNAFTQVTEYTRTIRRLTGSTNNNGPQLSKYELMDSLEFFDYLNTNSAHKFSYRLSSAIHPNWVSVKPHLLNKEDVITTGRVSVQGKSHNVVAPHWFVLTSQRVIWVVEDIANFVELKAITNVAIEHDRFSIVTANSKNTFFPDGLGAGAFVQRELLDLVSTIRDQIRKVTSDNSWGSDLVSELQKLAVLFEKGLLSEAEFQAAKAKLLS
jgi:hypothetical protein